MAEIPDRRVALLSIHPKYARAILTGCKQVEFRRVAPSRDVRTVVVYATMPVGQVVGYFEVTGITTAPPAELWHSFHDVGGISYAPFCEYFSGRDLGHAIQIGTFDSFRNPLDLHDLEPTLTPPQSLTYLREQAKDRLRRYTRTPALAFN